MSEQKEVQKRIEAIEGLIREIESLPDPGARSLSRQLVQSLMDLHGAGFERMLEFVYRAGETGQRMIDDLGRDELVRSLLLLYGLHPLHLEARVVEALEKTRPYLRSHGGNVQLVRLTEAGCVTLRLEGSCHSCPSSAVTLQSTVEQAIYEAAPDVTEIIVEGAVEKADPSATFVPLAQLGGRMDVSRPEPASLGHTDWRDVSDLDTIPAGVLQQHEIGGQSVLLCKVNEDFYAYGVTCPGCGQPLADGLLDNEVLACPTCKQRYDLVHAGRGLDVSTLHLNPIPLLRENGRARVAIISQAQGSGR
jgi:Fe-S cluster biogenesis protein NfuA/nitrite reductase/ring-hydroxylating ferredoxin subunit